MKITLIGACSLNGVIGADGKIPWHSKEDFQFFKETTMGKPIIMGRKTWESLPNKPLPGRANIVLSKSDLAPNRPHYQFFDLHNLLVHCQHSYDHIFVIGGSQLYEQFEQYADEVILSVFDFNVVGDTYWPIHLKDWKSEVLKKYSDFEVRRYTK